VAAPGSPSTATVDVIIQFLMQNKIPEVASAACSLFQCSAGDLVKEELHIKQQMQNLIAPETKSDVLDLILGLGGAAAVLAARRFYPSCSALSVNSGVCPGDVLHRVL
jgi:hypothetical protein